MTFLSADVMEYVPDADMIFNYLMISALAAATDYIEREGLKPSGGKLENVAIHHIYPLTILLICKKERSFNEEHSSKEQR